MFDWVVCLLTLENVAVMLTFIAIGYILCRCGALPESTGQILSRLLTMVFCPAYTIMNLSTNLSMQQLTDKLPLFGYGMVVVVGGLLMAYSLSRLLGRSVLERKSLVYAFAISNFGYFGYPVVAGVFGDQALTDMILMCIPLSILTNTFGYVLFADSRLSWKKVVFSPMLLGVVVGMTMGLTGLQMPVYCAKVLQGAADCMGVASMLLGGVVLAAMPLKTLIRGWRPYLYTFIRLVLIPGLFVGVMYACGVRGMLLLIPGVTLAMPLGLNLVVFPASFGYDTRDNAKMCFVSYLLALPLLPLIFGILQTLSQR